MLKSTYGTQAYLKALELEYGAIAPRAGYTSGGFLSVWEHGRDHLTLKSLPVLPIGETERSGGCSIAVDDVRGCGVEVHCRVVLDLEVLKPLKPAGDLLEEAGLLSITVLATLRLAYHTTGRDGTAARHGE